MWLMTTKARPKAARETIEACHETHMQQKAIMYVDGNPKGYDFPLPPNWQRVTWAEVGGVGNLAGSMRYIFEQHPRECVYGWLADDNIPETPYWSYMVEELAHPWRLVHCRDKFVSEEKHSHFLALIQTRNLGGGMCWGGELVRAVGWWTPPGVLQGSIDWVWTALVGGTPLGLYVHNVIVRHDNWRTGRREQDDNDDLTKPHIVHDVERIKNYIKTGEFHELKKGLLERYEQYVTSRTGST